MNFNDYRYVFSAVIAAAGHTSPAVALGGLSVLALDIPATGSGDFDANSAYLIFHVAMDGADTFKILKDKDNQTFAVAIAANNTNGAVYLPANIFAGWRLVKVQVVKSDKATAQTQTAETTIKLIGGKLITS